MTLGLAIGFILALILALIVGALAPGLLRGRQREEATPLPSTPTPTSAPALVEAEAEHQKLLEAARTEAEQIRRTAELEAKEVALRAQETAERELAEKRAELEKTRVEVVRKENQLAQRTTEMSRRDEDLGKKERWIAGREQSAEANAKKAEEVLAAAHAQLEKTAGLTADQAREQLQAEVIEAARKAAAGELQRIETATQAEAEARSKSIIATAIQRYASEYVTERTVAVVPLPSDDLKGRIIGREGRNIRALEAATGIDLIIDDTPEAVIISCFHPVRREVARLALTRLIADGRIHPTRIEEVVEKCEAEVEQQCKEAGEQAIFDLGLGKIHPELVRMLGQLKFRSSHAQNLLQHSIEVGFLAGAMAAELGQNIKLARRAGLLHDIGKAVDHEVEGSHAAVGAALCKKLGEAPRVVQAIAAHHGEEPAQSILDHIVDAANVLSSQRPGARRELLQSYISRLEELEKLCAGFPGVEKAYALQMGKEVRVLVENSQITDDQVVLLSRDIARRIEDSLAYPGQVRVCVIRETRATDYAR